MQNFSQKTLDKLREMCYNEKTGAQERRRRAKKDLTANVKPFHSKFLYLILCKSLQKHNHNRTQILSYAVSLFRQIVLPK